MKPNRSNDQSAPIDPNLIDETTTRRVERCEKKEGADFCLVGIDKESGAASQITGEDCRSPRWARTLARLPDPLEAVLDAGCGSPKARDYLEQLIGRESRSHCKIEIRSVAPTSAACELREKLEAADPYPDKLLWKPRRERQQR
jgi:hypothetical protein